MVAVDTMLESGLQFDAVFALNDLLAWGVLRELRERGVAVPDDVRVIGFDDVEESAYMVPSLSTVNPGREAIARLAVESIINRSNPAVALLPKPSRPPIASPCASPHRRWPAPDESMVRNIRSE